MARQPKGHDLNPKRDKRGLLPTQAVIVDNILDIGPRAAVELAYPDSPNLNVSRAISVPAVAEAISKAATRRGLTLNSGLDAIKESLSDPKDRLRAGELTVKIHGGLKDSGPVVAVPVSKEQFIDLCRTFWTTKPA